MMFPKQIHFCWIGPLDEIPEEDKSTPTEWARANPDYSVITWNEAQVRAMIEQYFPNYLHCWNRINLNIKKADFARLLILFLKGGIYLDYDLKPLRQLTEFFQSGEIYNRLWDGITPQDQPNFQPAIDKVDFEKYDMILSKETSKIDAAGYGVANGVMAMKAGEEWIIKFIDQQKDKYLGRVLDFMGPHALTRFIRNNTDLFSGRTCLLPCHYFLLRESMAPDYAMSYHPFNNSWGDHSKPKFWDVVG